jgi:hypothetical protein
MWLTACAPLSPVVKTQTVQVSTPVYVPLPTVLTADIPVPPFPAKTPLLNKDLAQYILDLNTALHKANDQLDKIRSLQPGGAP